MNMQANYLREVLQINEVALSLYREQLRKSSVGQDYLKKRRISQQVIDLFDIGYTSNTNDLILALGGKYSEDVLLAAGLIEYTGDKKIKDFFSEGIVLPWRDHYQCLRGFTTRLLVFDSGTDKYPTTYRSLLFKKGQLLYGFNLAVENILCKGCCLLTEGHWDVLALASAGHLNSVATGGASFFPQQAELLSAVTKKVILLFDQDEAGRHATEKAKIILSKYGVEAIAPSYKRKDIAEVYEQDGPGAVQEIVGARNVIC